MIWLSFMVVIHNHLTIALPSSAPFVWLWYASKASFDHYGISHRSRLLDGFFARLIVSVIMQATLLSVLVHYKIPAALPLFFAFT